MKQKDGTKSHIHSLIDFALLRRKVINEHCQDGMIAIRIGILQYSSSMFGIDLVSSITSVGSKRTKTGITLKSLLVLVSQQVLVDELPRHFAQSVGLGLPAHPTHSRLDRRRHPRCKVGSHFVCPRRHILLCQLATNESQTDVDESDLDHQLLRNDRQVWQDSCWISNAKREIHYTNVTFLEPGPGHHLMSILVFFNFNLSSAFVINLISSSSEFLSEASSVQSCLGFCMS